MFGETQAISTVKPVSQNYASATGSARVVQPFHFWTDSKYFKQNTAVFHGDGYFLQNADTFKDLRMASISVKHSKECLDVNSSTKGIQVNLSICGIFTTHFDYTNLRFATQI